MKRKLTPSQHKTTHRNIFSDILFANNSPVYSNSFVNRKVTPIMLRKAFLFTEKYFSTLCKQFLSLIFLRVMKIREHNLGFRLQ